MKQGVGGVVCSAEQMKQLEKLVVTEILKTETLKSANIKQELLKLKSALQQQGRGSNRRRVR
jgi:hypothetical protein